MRREGRFRATEGRRRLPGQRSETGQRGNQCAAQGCLLDSSPPAGRIWRFRLQREAPKVHGGAFLEPQHDKQPAEENSSTFAGKSDKETSACRVGNVGVTRPAAETRNSASLAVHFLSIHNICWSARSTCAPPHPRVHVSFLAGPKNRTVASISWDD